MAGRHDENEAAPLILVIDDSEDLLEVVALTLVGEGYRVKCALEGEAGLAAVRTERPNLVLLDMMMPGIDGLEFLARLPRECAPAPPVIAMTGFAGYRERAVELGAVAALTKPASLELLVEAVASGLTRGLVTDETIERNRIERQNGLVRMDSARTAFMARLDAVWGAPLRASFRPLVRWLTLYHGFGIGMINLLRGSELFIEVASEADGDLLEGTHAARSTSYCDDVLDPGSTLVIVDAYSHASQHFRDREEMRLYGWRFYAGTSINTPRGIVIGTLCLVAREPHSIQSEDMKLLEALALGVGRGLQGLADGMPYEPPLVDAALVFEPGLLMVFLEVAIARTARHGGCVEVALIDVRDEDRSRVAMAAYAASGGMGFVAVRGSEWPLSLIASGADQSRVRLSMQNALAAAARFDAVQVVSVIPWSADAPTSAVPHVEAMRCLDFAHNAWRQRGARSATDMEAMRALERELDDKR